MKSIINTLSIVIFLAGCLAIVCGGVYVWLYIVITTTKQFGIMAGWLSLFASAGLLLRYHETIRLPWDFWLGLWRWADDEIGRRFAKGD